MSKQKCSPHPWGSAYGSPMQAPKIVPDNFVKGALVPQNPNDELASELLKRFQAVLEVGNIKIKATKAKKKYMKKERA